MHIRDTSCHRARAALQRHPAVGLPVGQRERRVGQSAGFFQAFERGPDARGGGVEVLMLRDQFGEEEALGAEQPAPGFGRARGNAFIYLKNPNIRMGCIFINYMTIF